jgi:hypothetical protein
MIKKVQIILMKSLKKIIFDVYILNKKNMMSIIKTLLDRNSNYLQALNNRSLISFGHTDYRTIEIVDLNNLNDRAHSLYHSEHEENSSSDYRYYGPWITEIILFQACLPFVPPLSAVSLNQYHITGKCSTFQLCFHKQRCQSMDC